MGFAFSIKQNVSRFDVSMQNTVLMRVVNGARDLGDQLRSLPDRHRRAPDYFVKLPAFNEFHAEVTGAIPFAYFVNWNDARMIETRGGFRFPAETFHVRFAGPLTKVNDF
jgi:hypothetical protein